MDQIKKKVEDLFAEVQESRVLNDVKYMIEYDPELTEAEKLQRTVDIINMMQNPDYTAYDKAIQLLQYAGYDDKVYMLQTGGNMINQIKYAYAWLHPKNKAERKKVHRIANILESKKRRMKNRFYLLWGLMVVITAILCIAI